MDEHATNADILIKARTEQLRTAMQLIEKLCTALQPYRPDVVEEVRKKLNG